MVKQFVAVFGVRTLTVGLLLAILIGCAVSGAAQEVNGTLYGKVVDESNLPLPGATVTITSPDMIRGAMVAVTNERGLYRVPALSPGNYAVKVEMLGFRAATLQDIQLKAGMALAADFALKVAGVEENVTVTGGAPLVDVLNSQTQQVMGLTQLTDLPTGRGVSDALLTMPGVSDGEYVFAPVQTVHGGSVRDNRYTIDGTGANDTDVGYMQEEISYDMMEEIQVTTSGISAEFGQASGGVFNFVTKSGGDQFHGLANFFGQGKSLTGSNLTPALVSRGLTQGSVQVKKLEEGGALGGPILRKRLWFFGNLRYLDAASSQPDFPLFNPTTTQKQGFLKLTSALTSAIRAEGSYTQEIYNTFPDFSTSGVSAFSVAHSPENWRDLVRNPKIIHLGSTWTVTDRTLLEARFSRSFKQFVWTTPNNPASDVGYLDVATGLEYGGITDVPIRERKKMDEGMFQVNLSHYQDNLLGGSHNFKVGFYAEGSPFLDLALFPAGQNFMQLVNSGQPYRVRLYDTPATNAADITRYAAFGQDQWILGDRLTINAGVRLESTNGWTPQQQLGNNQWFPVTTYPERDNLIKTFTVAPRLGFVWALDKENKTAAKFSYGRYYDSILVGSVPNPISFSYAEYDWNDVNRDGKFEPGEQTTLRQAFASTASPPLDPNLKDPYIDEINVGIERQLSKTLGISLAGIFWRQRDIQGKLDLNKPASAYLPITVTNAATNQPMTIYALNPAYQTVVSSFELTNPAGLYRNYKGLEFVAHKRMSDGWEFQASINLGRADGNLGNSFGTTTGGTVYSNPNSFINMDGPMDLDSTFQMKLSGTYKAPYGILLSSSYTAMTGYPLRPTDIFPTDPAMGAYTCQFSKSSSPQIIVESTILVACTPRGTYREDFRNLVSLRGEKDFNIGHTRLSLLADVFNLLNTSSVLAVQTLKVELANFLEPAAIENPRALRLGVRIDF